MGLFRTYVMGLFHIYTKEAHDRDLSEVSLIYVSMSLYISIVGLFRIYRSLLNVSLKYMCLGLLGLQVSMSLYISIVGLFLTHRSLLNASV